MKIQIRYFASVREALGMAQEDVVLPSNVGTIAQLRHHLIARGGVWEEALAERNPLRMAYNQVMSEPDTGLTDGCEVAFFPPVTGG
jgi:molybdopterin synthase sulfur carrier subunit